MLLGLCVGSDPRVVTLIVSRHVVVEVTRVSMVLDELRSVRAEEIWRWRRRISHILRVVLAEALQRVIFVKRLYLLVRLVSRISGLLFVVFVATAVSIVEGLIS